MERTSQQWSFLSLSANVTFVQTDFSDVTRAVSGAGRRGRRMGLPPARALLPTEHTAAAQGGGARNMCAFLTTSVLPVQGY